MAYLAEFLQRGIAHGLRRAIGGYQLGEGGLDIAQLFFQRVIFGVRNFRRVFLVVQLVMALDLAAQNIRIQSRLHGIKGRICFLFFRRRRHDFLKVSRPARVLPW